MPPSVRGIVEKLKGTKRIYLHYARNQCPNKGNAVIEREKLENPYFPFPDIMKNTLFLSLKISYKFLHQDLKDPLILGI